MAFAASVFTVIYTGLRVIGSRADFDADFRAVTLVPGEVREIRFVVDSPLRLDAARLELEVPAILRLVGAGGPQSRTVGIRPGSNEFTIAVEAVASGQDFIVARVFGDEAIGRDRVFVTVAVD